MNIAFLKDGVNGLNVYSVPGGDHRYWSDALDPKIWIQPLHVKTVDGVEWQEVTYIRPKEKQQRGWVRKDKLVINRNPMFVENMSVHDHQTKYEEAVKFPKNSTDIPVPEPSPPKFKIIGWLLLVVIAVGLIALWVI